MSASATEGASSIRAAEIASLARSYRGCDLFAGALDSVHDPEALLRRLSKYVQFNAVFGSGVASLAGAIGCRSDLFRDPGEPLAAFADGSMEIAASIFYSAIDEFGGSQAGPTHRVMARDFLKAAAAHSGCPLPRLVPGEDFSAAVGEGYGIGRKLSDGELFQAMGFHLGSELLADQEFGILDRFLRSRYGELVRRLEGDRSTGYPAYLWIQVHTTVEADHFASGLRGAGQAIEFYSGAAPRWEMRDAVLAGARQFAALHGGFMRALAL